MSENKFPKSVGFNLKNEDDQKILKHIKKRKFSPYVKKLILEDIKRKELLRKQPDKNGSNAIVIKLEDTEVRK